MKLKIKQRILLIVSIVMIFFIIIAILSVHYEISYLVKHQSSIINNELMSQWQVKAEGLFNRYEKLLKIYEGIALENAAEYVSDTEILEAYLLANSGDLNDENDQKSKKARAIIKEKFYPKLYGIKKYSSDHRYMLNFHTKNIRSLARIWRKDWQLIRDGQKLDLTDDISPFRETIRIVKETLEPVTGIELGKAGFVVRGICPIIHNGEYLGSVESLLPFSEVTNNLTLGHEVNHVLYMPKKYLKITTSLNDQQKHPILDNEYVKVNSTADSLFDKIITLDIIKSFYNNSNFYIIDNNYISGITIKDYSGSIIGVLIISINTQIDAQKVNNNLQNINNVAYKFKLYFVLGGIFAFIFIISIISFFTFNIFQKLDYTHKLLKDSQDNYKQLFNNMIDSFALYELITNKHGEPIDYKLVLANSEFENQTGLNKSQAINKTATELNFDTPSSLFKKYCDVAINRFSYKYEYHSQNLDKYFDIFVFSPKEYFFALVSKDITLNKKHEIERKNRYQRILQSEKMRAVGQLSSGLAHDLNNKLCGIIGSADIINNKNIDEDTRKKYTTLILESAKDSATVVQKLLTFCEKDFTPKDNFNIQEVLNDSIRAINDKLPSSITLIENYTSNKVTIYGDRLQIFSMFVNVGINAIEAIADYGKIYINSTYIEANSDDQNSKENRYLYKVEIIDTGSGIPSSDLEKIYEPFFSTKGFGRGLGLSAVYGTVSQHKGDIHITSEIGKGTTVTITIPCTLTNKHEN